MSCQLSIIIPCYDIKLSELSKCIDSLEFIAQLMTYEIWIIDDGSHEDVVCEWVKNLNKENIHAIRQENMGPGGARNTGIDHCTGKYLTFIDADDYIFYGPYVQILKTLLEKEPDILCHGAKRLFEGPATMFMIKYDIIPSCCSYIIRHETVGDMRFSPHIYHEDEEFCTRLFLKRAHLVTSIEQAYFYRYRPDSITHKQDQKHLQKRYADYITVLQHLQSEKIPSPHSLALQRRLCIMAMCYVITLMSDSKNWRFTTRALQALRSIGLYPLPVRRWYGFRYLLTQLTTFHPFLVCLLSPITRLLVKLKNDNSRHRSFVAQVDPFG